MAKSTLYSYGLASIDLYHLNSRTLFQYLACEMLNLALPSIQHADWPKPLDMYMMCTLLWLPGPVPNTYPGGKRFVYVSRCSENLYCVTEANRPKTHAVYNFPKMCFVQIACCRSGVKDVSVAGNTPVTTASHLRISCWTWPATAPPWQMCLPRPALHRQWPGLVRTPAGGGPSPEGDSEVEGWMDVCGSRQVL